MENSKKAVNLLEGSISKGILQFCIPLFIGQLLQQLYNIADAWVVGNFAEENAFAAVSAGGSMCFLIVGFFGGMGAGGGIVISRYFGAGDKEMTKNAIHANLLFALVASVAGTIVSLLAIPKLLVMMDTPAEVLPYSLAYFRIYFWGLTTLIIYNVFMSVMRALGDSFHPLIYLLISSGTNIALDIILVAGFKTGVVGAAVATVVSQGFAALLCGIRMFRATDDTKIYWKEIFVWHGDIMKQIVVQGLPMGLQNSVISIGNIVVQTNINSFGSHAMSGMGAYSKIEGFVFLPITSMSMAIPTFISQNLGAKNYERAKKGARFGILSGVIFAEAIGFVYYIFAEPLLRLFVQDAESVNFGMIHVGVVSFLYFLLAFSHCAAGVMRGAGKSIVPMITMLVFWCGVRIIYVTCAIQIIPKFATISWCYPLTWTGSSVVFLIWLLRTDWVHAYEKKDF